jgi:NTP pyrophosphatase (non-canonical NTP hydrolase)
MEHIFELIREERKRQDVKWGAGRNLHNLEWLTILVEEVGEAAKVILEGSNLQEEVLHVAAVAVVWLECLNNYREK